MAKTRPPNVADQIGELPILVEMATQMGNVAGQVSQMNERLNEMHSGQQALAHGQQDLAAALERIAVTQSASEEKLGAVTGRLDGMEDRLGALERRLDDLKPPAKGDGVSAWDEFLGFLWKWAPRIAAAVLAIGAAVVAYLKGGDTQP